MSPSKQLAYECGETVSREMPHLRKSQALVLTLWSLGMVWAGSCCLTAVTIVLAPLLGVYPNTIRQRLREWCLEAEKERGPGRVTIPVESSFAPLLRWVLSNWTAGEVALALDATSLAACFTVLVVSVVYRGCGIPVAWTVLRAK